MIRTWIVGLLGSLAICAQAQEPQRISAETAERVVQFLTPEFAKLDSPPLKVELDAKRAGGLSAGDSRALLVVFDQAFNADSIKAAKEKPVTVGVALVVGIALASDGKALPTERLKTMSITTPGGDVRKLTVLWLRLKTTEGKLVLEALSNGANAVLTLPVSEVANGTGSIDVTAQPLSDQHAKLLVTLLGKLQVTLEVVAP